VVSFRQVFSTKTVSTFSPSFLSRILFILLPDSIVRIVLGVVYKSWNYSGFSFFPSPVTSSFSSPNMFLRTLFSHTPSHFAALNATGRINFSVLWRFALYVDRKTEVSEPNISKWVFWIWKTTSVAHPAIYLVTDGYFPRLKRLELEAYHCFYFRCRTAA